MPAKEIDEADLTDRVTKSLGGREVDPVTVLPGGTSSLTFWTTIRDDNRKVVVKVCPPGLEPVRNRDVLRQARVIKAMTGHVPVPEVFAEDAGEPPDVPPFFVMDYAAGECREITMVPAGEAPPPGDVRGRHLHAAEIMGRMHALDPVAVGLGDEPEWTLTQEVQRWIDMFDVCDEDLKAGTEDIGERLLATIPAALPTALLHGDFRTGNVMADGDHVTAVIDWEIWSRGDPRVDLAWFLQFHEDRRDSLPPGTPPVQELIDTYQSAWGGVAGDLDWFRVLVRYKQVAAGAFIQRNARRRGAAPQPVDNAKHPTLVAARSYLG